MHSLLSIVILQLVHADENKSSADIEFCVAKEQWRYWTSFMSMGVRGNGIFRRPWGTLFTSLYVFLRVGEEPQVSGGGGATGLGWGRSHRSWVGEEPQVLGGG